MAEVRSFRELAAAAAENYSRYLHGNVQVLASDEGCYWTAIAAKLPVPFIPLYKIVRHFSDAYIRYYVVSQRPQLKGSASQPFSELDIVGLCLTSIMFPL